MKKFLTTTIAILYLSVIVAAQSTAYRIFTRSSLPLNCSKTTSSTDIVIISGTNDIYICKNPLAVYPANWQFVGGGSSISGTTINSTDGAIPFRLNSTTFDNSPLVRTNATLITSTAGLVFSPDNTLDIGASGANRPRTGYFGTSVLTSLISTASGDLGLGSAGVTAFGISSTVFYPQNNNGRDLGVPGLTFRTGYFGTSIVSPLFNFSTTLTPTGTADAQGSVGDMRYDASFMYIKTADGWKRAALSTF